MKGPRLKDVKESLASLMGTKLQSSTEEKDSCKSLTSAALEQLRLSKLHTSFLFHVFSKSAYTSAPFFSTRSSHSESYDLLVLTLSSFVDNKSRPTNNS